MFINMENLCEKKLHFKIVPKRYFSHKVTLRVKNQHGNIVPMLL